MTPLLRIFGDTGAFAATWQPLATLLEVHASAGRRSLTGLA